MRGERKTYPFSIFYRARCNVKKGGTWLMGDGGAGGVEAVTNGREGPGVVSRRTNLEALLHHFWDVKTIEGDGGREGWLCHCNSFSDCL